MTYYKTLILISVIYLSSCTNNHTEIDDDPLQSRPESQQVFEYDSLKKYSYLIKYKSSIEMGGIGVGTGFLARKGNELLLISNLHILAAANLDPNIPPSPYTYDTIYLRYFTKQSSLPDSLAIDIRPIKNKFKNFDSFDSSDLGIIKINLPQDAIVNSIESYFAYPVRKYNPEKIVLFGYSHIENKTNTDTVFPEAYSGNLDSDINKSIGFRGEDGKITIVNYLIGVKPALYHGMSGSPVFFIYKDTVQGRIINSVIFGGVVTKGSEEMNNGLIIRANEVIRKYKINFRY